MTSKRSKVAQALLLSFIVLFISDYLLFKLLLIFPQTNLLTIFTFTSFIITLSIIILNKFSFVSQIAKNTLFVALLLSSFGLNYHKLLSEKNRINNLNIIGKRTEFKVVVKTINKKEKYSKLLLNVKSIILNKKNIPSDFNLPFITFMPTKNISKNDTLLISCTLNEIKPEKNYGDFPLYKQSLMKKIIYTCSKVKIKKIIPTIQKDIMPIIKNKIITQFSTYLQPKYCSWQTALTIGEKSLLSSDTKEQFKKSGALHLLAVSGLHVGFVLLFLFGLKKIFYIKQITFTISSILFLLFYAELCSWQPSVTRAVIMAIVLLLSHPLKRIVNTLDIVSSAGVIILLLNPGISHNLGFQLSFISVYSIILLSPKITNLFNRKNKVKYKKITKFINSFIIQPLIISISVTIGLFPLILLNFGYINFISILSNLTLIPLAGISFFMGFTTLLAGLLNPLSIYPSLLISFYLEKINYLIFSFVEITNKIDYFSLKTYLPISIFVAIYILIIIVFIKKSKIKICILLVVLLSIISITIQPIISTKNDETCYYNEIGKSIAMLKNQNNRKFLFISKDCSSKIFNYKISSWLTKQNIKTIQFVATPFKISNKSKIIFHKQYIYTQKNNP